MFEGHLFLLSPSLIHLALLASFSQSPLLKDYVFLKRDIGNTHTWWSKPLLPVYLLFIGSYYLFNNKHSCYKIIIIVIFRSQREIKEKKGHRFRWFVVVSRVNFLHFLKFKHWKLINVKHLLGNSQKCPARLSALAYVSADLMGH